MILKATLPLFHPLFSSTLHLPQVSPEARLLRAARRGGPVALGTPDSPYEPAGRSPLAALEGFEGLEVAVVTRSAEIVREIELLADLDRRCFVTVELMIPAVRPGLAWLEAVARLAAEGIAVRVLCPLAAGVNDREPALRKLFGAARDAGAWDIRALAAPRNRPRLSLRPKTGAALATFLRLRLEYGFPRQMTGRG
jgi:DNA repair photolyase